jgi:hypothetical protein
LKAAAIPANASADVVKQLSGFDVEPAVGRAAAWERKSMNAGAIDNGQL